jgi:hypothetical protein
MHSLKTGERTGSRPSAAGGGGAQAPALRPVERRATSTQLLPGERCTIAPVTLQMADASVRLDIAHHHKTWHTGSGRQDHTILPYARSHRSSARRPRSRFPALQNPSHRCEPRPPPPGPRRDDRDTPLFLGPGCRNTYAVSEFRESGIFLLFRIDPMFGCFARRATQALVGRSRGDTSDRSPAELL